MAKAPQDTVDIWSKLRFDAESGSVWLDEQRMLLLHAGSLGALRAELIRTLGEDRASGLLFRMGYHSGTQDAEIARHMVGDGDYEQVFLLGPAMHQLEGVVRVEVIESELDLEEGTFSGEFRWHEGWEADSQLAEFGIGDRPTCWNQLGYATGYVSAFMGRRVVFRETSCRGKGDPHCTIIAKTASKSSGDDPDGDLMPDDIAGEIADLADEIHDLRLALRAEPSSSSLIGESKEFLKTLNLVRRAAQSSIAVLFTGETGVGKEEFARWLHDNSERRDKPFVAVNCGAIPHDLVESELFGVAQGAYTGATKSRLGRFMRADGGTLFLDEIGDLPYEAQVKLLRVLQTGEIDRLGGQQSRKVDVRLVTATNVDLAKAVKDKTFREDLFYRISPFPVAIPPLRERRTDIPLFVEEFVERLSGRHGKPIRGLSDKAMETLIRYDWPGNVRELENVLERGVMLAEPGGRIELDSLFLSLPQATQEMAGLGPDGRICPDQDAPSLENAEDLSLAHHEARLIEEAMRRADGNVVEAAKLLGITRRQIDYRLKAMREAG
ncbi:MAG: sigma-54-dependent Fis family transcriptional regulator [Erythrobacteraceae bacterium]|nr:sigma-54-dependent Fis family transcriptional regulator [Erythrobacteraceae bacterium]